MATIPEADPIRELSIQELLELSALPEADASVWVRTDSIRMGERLRPVDEVWAGALGDLMQREGQRTAIDVCRDPDNLGGWLLHGAGGHRLRGGQLREIENLKVLVWPHDPNAAKLREIADNLHRRDLDPYDRAVFIAEAVACYKRAHGIDPAKDGRSASAAARWQQALADEAEDTNVTLTLVYGWTADVAEQLGVSKSTIERGLKLYRRIDREQMARLREGRHPIATNASELTNLAKLDPEQQKATVDQLIDQARPAKSVSEALARIKQPNAAPRSPADRRFDAILGALQRMGAADRLGLFQSPRFHALMPAEARRLLAPMLRDGEPRAEAGDAMASVAVVAASTPAVPIRQSVKPGHIACLECGEKVVNLQAHLSDAHGVKPADYLLRWKLPADYPMVAPSSEPSAALIEECRGDLALIHAIVLSWYGKPARDVLAAIEQAGGYRFANGTYELKLGKVKATSTAGGEILIGAWRRKAEERLYPEDGDA